jgi:DNA polymerase (family 10)
MDKTGVARVLDQMASLLELKGENAFRVRAFRNASRTIAAFPGDLGEAIADGSLAAARGIGPALEQIVTDLARTNRSPVYEELREVVPPGLVEMLAISGLGVAKVRLIHERLGIESLGDLEGAASDGRLAGLPGFGPRSCENVLKGLARLRRAAGARLLHHAAREAEELRAALERLPGVRRAIVAGDVRRRLELVRDLVIVLLADVPPAEILRQLAEVPGVDEFAGQDERRATVRFAGGSLVQVVVTPPLNLGAVLVQATGSEGHVARLAARAATRGHTLQGAALWRGSEFVPTPDEATVYTALGLPELPPELREDRGELERFAASVPPLITMADLRGFLHCHTSFSDGSSSVEELAVACRAAGYQYLGITDHSAASAYAGGLRREDLPRQWDEVDAVNRRLDGIRVLKGIEVDILPSGELDYGDEVLRRFDFVIASIHSHFTLTEAEMTARILRAMDCPWTTIIGHPTGRLLLSRDGYPLDLPAVFRRAAERGVALEINADPHRMDLDWRVLGEARSAGALISIGADAHSVAGLDNVSWGVGVTRKAGLGPADILNARSLEDFLAFAGARR